MLALENIIPQTQTPILTTNTNNQQNILQNLPISINKKTDNNINNINITDNTNQKKQQQLPDIVDQQQQFDDTNVNKFIASEATSNLNIENTIFNEDDRSMATEEAENLLNGPEFRNWLFEKKGVTLDNNETYSDFEFRTKHGHKRQHLVDFDQSIDSDSNVLNPDKQGRQDIIQIFPNLKKKKSPKRFRDFSDVDSDVENQNNKEEADVLSQHRVIADEYKQNNNTNTNLENQISFTTPRITDLTHQSRHPSFEQNIDTNTNNPNIDSQQQRNKDSVINDSVNTSTLTFNTNQTQKQRSNLYDSFNNVNQLQKQKQLQKQNKEIAALHKIIRDDFPNFYPTESTIYDPSSDTLIDDIPILRKALAKWHSLLFDEHLANILAPSNIPSDSNAHKSDSDKSDKSNEDNLDQNVDPNDSKQQYSDVQGIDGDDAMNQDDHHSDSSKNSAADIADFIMQNSSATRPVQAIKRKQKWKRGRREKYKPVKQRLNFDTDRRSTNQNVFKNRTRDSSPQRHFNNSKRRNKDKFDSNYIAARNNKKRNSYFRTRYGEEFLNHQRQIRSHRSERQTRHTHKSSDNDNNRDNNILRDDRRTDNRHDDRRRNRDNNDNSNTNNNRDNDNNRDRNRNQNNDDNNHDSDSPNNTPDSTSSMLNTAHRQRNRVKIEDTHNVSSALLNMVNAFERQSVDNNALIDEIRQQRLDANLNSQQQIDTNKLKNYNSILNTFKFQLNLQSDDIQTIAIWIKKADQFILDNNIPPDVFYKNVVSTKIDNKSWLMWNRTNKLVRYQNNFEDLKKWIYHTYVKTKNIKLLYSQLKAYKQHTRSTAQTAAEILSLYETYLLELQTVQHFGVDPDAVLNNDLTKPVLYRMVRETPGFLFDDIRKNIWNLYKPRTFDDVIRVMEEEDDRFTPDWNDINKDNSQQTNTNIYKTKRYCSICKTETHNTINCRFANKPRRFQRSIRFCTICKKGRHLRNDCPLVIEFEEYKLNKQRQSSTITPPPATTSKPVPVSTTQTLTVIKSNKKADFKCTSCGRSGHLAARCFRTVPCIYCGLTGHNPFFCRKKPSAANSSQTPRVDVTKIRCFNCNNFGHFMRDCTKPRRP